MKLYRIDGTKLDRFAQQLDQLVETTEREGFFYGLGIGTVASVMIWAGVYWLLKAMGWL